METTPAPAPGLGAKPVDAASNPPAPANVRGATVHVLLADDHRVMRQALASMLADREAIEVVGQATNGREAVELTRRLRPDVVVMDARMPGMDGVEATRLLLREMPEVKVIGLSLLDETDEAQGMLQAGAVAYVCKDRAASALLDAIQASCPCPQLPARPFLET